MAGWREKRRKRERRRRLLSTLPRERDFLERREREKRRKEEGLYALRSSKVGCCCFSLLPFFPSILSPQPGIRKEAQPSS